MLLVVLLASLIQGTSQNLDTASIIVRQIDLRNYSAETAVASSLQASQKQVVIILVQNGNADLITQTELDIKGLTRAGYERLILVVGQGLSNEPESIISIYAGGHTYALMKNVSPNAQTSANLFKLIQDAYHENIMVKQ